MKRRDFIAAIFATIPFMLVAGLYLQSLLFCSHGPCSVGDVIGVALGGALAAGLLVYPLVLFEIWAWHRATGRA